MGLSSRFEGRRYGGCPRHRHFVGWACGPSTRLPGVISAVRRRSGGSADELDKLRERGLFTTLVPIHTLELTSPTLTPERRQDIRVRRLLLARIPGSLG